MTPASPPGSVPGFEGLSCGGRGGGGGGSGEGGGRRLRGGPSGVLGQAGGAGDVPDVQGQAPAPTPDCCAGLKTVLQSSRKCLCVLVKDRDEPGLGIKINVTKALGLPSVCRAAANVSDCPGLLNLPPGSKDAEVFEQFGKQQGAPASPSGGASSAPSTGAQKNDAAARMRWLGMGGVGGVAVALSFFFGAVPLALHF